MQQGQPMAQAPNLAIWIVSCSCSCGNKWTHSYTTFLAGGKPNDVEEAKGKVTRLYDHSKQHVNHCFLCATLGLGLGWQKPQASPAQAPSVRSQTGDLRAKISSLLED